MIRQKNEDRVSVIVNREKIKNFPISRKWPEVSFFAIYDRHGGILAANYLRDRLHELVS